MPKYELNRWYACLARLRGDTVATLIDNGHVQTISLEINKQFQTVSGAPEERRRQSPERSVIPEESDQPAKHLIPANDTSLQAGERIPRRAFPAGRLPGWVL